jgi:putative DNA methylase
LNPVAVLINKAMIEIPPRFAGRAPVGPIPASEKQIRMAQDWPGAQGLAEDVRRYGAWMREEAFKRIGHLYPQVDLPKEHGGGKATVIAWLWARTVKSPNPAFSHVDVPLASTFILSSKAGKESYVQPVIEGDSYHFEVKGGKPPESAKSGTKLARGANFRCLLSDSPIEPQYVKAEGVAGRIGQKLMATVAEGARGRIYLAPSIEMESIACESRPSWRPGVDLSKNSRHMTPKSYGFSTFGDLFTPRQLVAMTTFADLVREVREKVKYDAINESWFDDGQGIENAGTNASAYADAVAVYMAIFLSRMVDLNNNLCQWRSDPAKQHVGHLFSRQAIPMVWDFAEANPLGNSAGGFDKTFSFVPKVFSFFPNNGVGHSSQTSARDQIISEQKIISTDPPYYDNIGYADLSDFFYVWLRRALRQVYPSFVRHHGCPESQKNWWHSFRTVTEARRGSGVFFPKWHD